jgi:protein-disulfide isomerase
MQNRFLSVCLALSAASTVTACHREGEDPELGRVVARLDAIEKRLDIVEKRAPGAAGAAAAQPARRPGPDPNTVYAVPVDADNSLRGASSAAKVTIVEGFDFACPYCAMSTPQVEQALVGHEGDVRVVSKQFVVHPQVATDAALGACAANKQGKGAEYEKAVWAAAWNVSAEKPSFDKDKLAPDALEKIAGQLGLDVGKFKTDRESQGCKDAIARDARELATVGVNGTPAFFINGKPYVGPRTADGFKQAIADEIKKADDAIAKGTPASGYYDALMKDAKKTL